MRHKTKFSPTALCIVLFLSGLVLGILGLRVLSVDEKAELVSYLEVFVGGLKDSGLEPKELFVLSASHNLKTAGLVWGLGLAVVGVPVVCILVIVRGFTLGFSASFLIKESAANGIGLFLTGMLPHNIVSIPSLLCLCSLSLSFSLMLFTQRPWSRGVFWPKVGAYTLKCLLFTGMLLLSSLVEAYISCLLLARSSL